MVVLTVNRIIVRLFGVGLRPEVSPSHRRDRGIRKRARMDQPARRMQPQIVTETAESERKVAAALQRNRELGKGLKEGKTFKIQVARGYAWYEATHVGPTSAEVEWRDYGLDRCMDEMLAGGGEFPRRLIERLVHHHDTLEELFGAPSEPWPTSDHRSEPKRHSKARAE
jgi:hypothetical protein